MARVSIEDRADAWAQNMSDDTGIPKWEIIGRLHGLWRETQRAERIEIPLRTALRYLDLEPGDKSAFFCGKLEEFGFITVKKSLVTVVGNASHIENLRGFREKGAKGGKQRVENERIRKKGENFKPTLGMGRKPNLSAGLSPYSTVHTSIQGDSRKRDESGDGEKGGGKGLESFKRVFSRIMGGGEEPQGAK